MVHERDELAGGKRQRAVAGGRDVAGLVPVDDLDPRILALVGGEDRGGSRDWASNHRRCTAPSGGRAAPALNRWPAPGIRSACCRRASPPTGAVCTSGPQRRRGSPPGLPGAACRTSRPRSRSLCKGRLASSRWTSIRFVSIQPRFRRQPTSPSSGSRSTRSAAAGPAACRFRGSLPRPAGSGHARWLGLQAECLHVGRQQDELPDPTLAHQR